MKKIIWTLIIVLSTLCGLVFLTSYCILNSEKGSRWLINTALSSVPGKLHIGTIKGELTETIKLTDVSYHYQGNTVTIDKVAFSLRLSKLLNRKLTINRLEINNLGLKLSKNTSASYKSTPIILPLKKLHLKSTEIKKISIESPTTATPVVFNALVLHAKLYPELLHLQFITYMTSPSSMNFRLEASGKLDNYQLDFVVEQATNRWYLKGEGDLNHFKFHTNENQLLGGTVKLLGEVDFSPNVKWLAEAEIKGINPQSLVPSWPGHLNFSIKSHVEKNAVTIDLTDLSGFLKQHPVSGEFHYHTANGHDHLIDSNLHYGKGSLIASGKINDHINLTWDIKIPQLQDIAAEYALGGSVISQGTLLGPREKPSIKATVNAQQLHFQTWSAEKLQLTAHYQNNQLPMAVQLSLNNVQHDKQSLGNMQTEMIGTQNQHTIKTKYTLDKKLLDLEAKGSFSDEFIWNGTLNRLKISSPDSQSWHLQSATPLTLSREAIDVAPLCVLHDKVSLCLNAQWKKGSAFNSEITTKKIPLDILNPWLGDLNMHGEISAAAKLNISPNNTPTLDLKIELIPGFFTYIVENVSRHFKYQGGVITAQLNEHKFTAKVALELLQKSTLTANIHSDTAHWNPQNWSSSPLQGDFKLLVPQLDFLAALIPKIAQTHGSLNGHGTIGGTLKQPTLNGAATVSNAGFTVPDVNSEAKNMSATGTLHAGILSYQGTGTSGAGSFKISGTTQILNKQLHTQLHLQGKDMLISNTPGVVVTANPELKMNIVDRLMSLNGTLFIPKGQFRSYDYNDTLELPDEISYRQKTSLKPSESEPVQLTSTIELRLGDNITIDSNGLSGKLRGGITIEDNPAGATTAYGNLSLSKGKYDFRGQTLDVERGALNFNGGPISNPNLNVRAVRYIGQHGPIKTTTASDQNRIVGINISGTLAKHTLSLFSEPDDITQSDILSYLVLGQSVNAVSGSKPNAQALLGAATALNLGGGGGTLSRFKSQLEQKLGLTELDITSYETKDKSNPESTIQHTAFVLGRYLSPKLYVKYSFDILDQTNVFRIRYFLNTKWSIQSESSLEGNALDVLYSFERG